MSLRFRAFMCGCLSALLGVLPVYSALAGTQQPSDSDAIYRVFPETQDYPANSSEEFDAIRGMNSGLNYENAVEPQPLPIRDYVAMLNDIWAVLFGVDYDAESSGLYFAEWPENQGGEVVGANETGIVVDATVLLSIDCPPAELDVITPEDIAVLENSTVRFGGALVEMRTLSGTVRMSCAWLEIRDLQGAVVTKVFPLSIILDEIWNDMGDYLPLVMDVFSDLWSGDPRASNPLGRFRENVASAGRKFARKVGRAVVGAALIAVVGVAVGTAAPVIAIAAAVVIVKAAIDAAEQFEEDVQDAIDELADEMDDDGIFPYADPDDLTNEQIIGIAEEVYGAQ